jgi:hypothetical protein
MSGEKKRVDEENGFKHLVDLLDPNTHCLNQLHRLREEVFAEGALSQKHKQRKRKLPRSSPRESEVTS